jgi:predicted nucleotidyltransferase
LTQLFSKKVLNLAETIERLPLEFFSIELLPFLDGKSDFTAVYQRSNIVTVEGLNVRVISYEDLIACKANVHRAKDLEDIAQLETRRKKQNQN